MNKKMEAIVKEIDRLPPFPQVVMQAMEILQDPESSADDVVKVIQYDQAVTANCLMLCNSSYFGLKDRVDSLKHAVVLLGASNLVRVVVADNFRAAVFHRGRYGHKQKPEALWWHCATTAIISQLLARKVGFSDAHALFTASLLHDMGKLVIDRFVSDDFENMAALMQEEGFGKLDAEKSYFGIDHAAVGGMIAEAWEMPEELIHAIVSHHEPDAPLAEPGIASLTAVSNMLHHHFLKPGDSKPSSENQTPLKNEIMDSHGLTSMDVEDIGKNLPTEIKKAAEILRLPTGGESSAEDLPWDEGLQR